MISHAKKLLTGLAVVLLAGCAGAGPFDLVGSSWKEEAVQHDGSVIIVKRSQTYRGRHEIGQSTPVGEHTIKFELPGSNTSLNWTSEYGEDLGRTNFNLLALHVLNGAPYLIVEPNLCLAYNKWGRPNPPYVLFKHDGKEWRRIAISELPTELKTINLIVINSPSKEPIANAIRQFGFTHISAIDVAKANKSLTQPHYRSIIREPLPPGAAGVSCEEMVPDGNGGWMGTGFFSRQPSYEACLIYCESNRIRSPYCLCDKYFKLRELK